MNLQREAEALIGQPEFPVDGAAVLELALASGCSAYDCEFVTLARQLDTALVTSDRKLLTTFPETASSPDSFLNPGTPSTR